MLARAFNALRRRRLARGGRREAREVQLGYRARSHLDLGVALRAMVLFTPFEAGLGPEQPQVPCCRSMAIAAIPTRPLWTSYPFIGSRSDGPLFVLSSRQRASAGAGRDAAFGHAAVASARRLCDESHDSARPRGYGARVSHGTPSPRGYAPPSGPHPNSAAPQTYRDTAPAFPARLDDAPADSRLDETFGWFPGAVALGSVIAIIAWLIGVARRDKIATEDLEVLGGAAAVALLFGFWEVARRLRPTSLGLGNGAIGIYRRGALDSVVPYGQVAWYRLHIVNTIREYAFFGILTLGAVPVVPSMMARDLVFGLLMAALGLGSALGLASAIWSRSLCYHYMVPEGSGTEEVTFKRSDLKRFGWPIK